MTIKTPSQILMPIHVKRKKVVIITMSQHLKKHFSISNMGFKLKKFSTIRIIYILIRSPSLTIKKSLTIINVLTPHSINVTIILFLTFKSGLMRIKITSSIHLCLIPHSKIKSGIEKNRKIRSY